MKNLLILVLSVTSCLSFAENDAFFGLQYSNASSDNSKACEDYFANAHKIKVNINKNPSDLLFLYPSAYGTIRELQNAKATQANLTVDSTVYKQFSKLYKVANNEQKVMIKKMLTNASFDNNDLEILLEDSPENYETVLKEGLKVNKFVLGTYGDNSDYLSFMIRNFELYDDKAIANMTVVIDDQKSTLPIYTESIRGGMFHRMTTNDKSFLINHDDVNLSCGVSAYGSSKSVLSCSCKSK